MDMLTWFELLWVPSFPCFSVKLLEWNQIIRFQAVSFNTILVSNSVVGKSFPRKNRTWLVSDVGKNTALSFLSYVHNGTPQNNLETFPNVSTQWHCKPKVNHLFKVLVASNGDTIQLLLSHCLKLKTLWMPFGMLYFRYEINKLLSVGQ